MQARLVSGRFFDDRDTGTNLRTIVVDERLATRFWPGQDASAVVGRRVFEPSSTSGDIYAVDADTQWVTVIGVVGEVKLRGLVEGVGDSGAYYMPHAQQGGRSLTFAVRTAGDPGGAAPAVRAALREVDRELPIFDVQPMAERVERGLLTRRVPMMLALAFGGVALLLAAVGIYGVLAYLVAQRRKEIGIRIALGSSRAAVVHLVLREGLVLVLLGLVVGVAGAAALRRTVESVLFGVEPTNPLVLAAAVAVLAGAGLLASLLPARRAAGIDPIVALAE
jgi:hypothetical protein